MPVGQLIQQSCWWSDSSASSYW